VFVCFDNLSLMTHFVKQYQYRRLVQYMVREMVVRRSYIYIQHGHHKPCVCTTMCGNHYPRSRHHISPSAA